MASVQTLLGLGSPREWEPTTCAEIHRPGGGGRPARDRRTGLTRVSRPDGPEGRRAPGPLPPTPHARGGGSRRRGPEPPAGPSADAPGSGAGRGPCVAPGARRSLAACAWRVSPAMPTLPRVLSDAVRVEARRRTDAPTQSSPHQVSSRRPVPAADQPRTW